MRRLIKTAAEHGQPVSVIQGRRKPGDRWLPSDTTCALAWREFSDSTCPGCGHRRSESMAREATGKYRAQAWRCHACDAVSDAVGQARDRKVPNPGALYFTAERLDEQRPAGLP